MQKFILALLLLTSWAFNTHAREPITDDQLNVDNLVMCMAYYDFHLGKPTTIPKLYQQKTLVIANVLAGLVVTQDTTEKYIYQKYEEIRSVLIKSYGGSYTLDELCTDVILNNEDNVLPKINFKPKFAV